MQYLVLYPPDDENIKACMSHWLAEAGGTLSWDEVQKKLYQRFKYVTKTIHNEEEMRRMNLKGKAYLFKDGMVSLSVTSGELPADEPLAKSISLKALFIFLAGNPDLARRTNFSKILRLSSV